MAGPDRTLELEYAGRVVGIDEVGRGPLCGPVVAGAVILPGAPSDGVPPDFAAIRDSKVMTAPRRAAAVEIISAHCLFGIGAASVEEIDRLGILQATFLAMRRAVEALKVTPDHALVDGNLVPKGLPCPARAIVKGDSRCLAIAAASILAKQHRDAIMQALAVDHPQYGWERNSGYGTQEHRDAIRLHGPTPHHRTSFRWGIEEDAQLSLFG